MLIRIYVYICICTFSLSLFSPLTICAPILPGSSREKCFSMIAAVFSFLLYGTVDSAEFRAKTIGFSPSHGVNHRRTWETSRARQAENTILTRRPSRADWSARASTLARLRFDCKQPLGAAADGRGCSRRILSGSFARLHVKRMSAILSCKLIFINASSLFKTLNATLGDRNLDVLAE